MTPTTSTAEDYISVQLLKDASSVINQLLLHLTNRVITTGNYPEILKTTKIVPIRKKGKPENESAGWRPINIVHSVSKVLEKVFLKQITDYLNRHKIINHTHHGSIRGKGTQTLVHKLYDRVLESLESGETSAIVQTDQSKAYNVVSHTILQQKMQYIGFNRNTMKILSSYMENRKQYVEVDGFASDKLLVGPRSVTQGSSLSCILYIIMILDISSIYHDTPHTPAEAAKCNAVNAKTFVDDNVLHVKQTNNLTIQDAVLRAITKLEEYTNANQLALNPEKSSIMVISSNKEIKENFSVSVHGKVLKHKQSLTVLGNVISADLTWGEHISKVVLPALANRLRTLKIITPYMNPKFKQMYASAIFRGKLVFAIDAWGGAAKTLISKIQDLQDRTTKFILGPAAAKKSASQRRDIMKWPSVHQEARLATLRLAHSVIHLQIPEELSTKMPLNERRLIKSTFKLDTKPYYLNKNKRTQSSFRNRAYDFNTLPHRITSLIEPKHFKKWAKMFIQNPYMVPNPLPNPDHTNPEVPHGAKKRAREAINRARKPRQKMRSNDESENAVRISKSIKSKQRHDRRL